MSIYLARGLSDESRVEPDDDGSDHDHRPIVGGALFVAGSQAPPLLEAVDAALDHVAACVGRLVEGERATWPFVASHPLIAALGNGVRDVPLAQEPPTARVAVAFVSDDAIRPSARPSPPTGAGHADALKHGCQLGAVMALSWGDHDRERPSRAVAGQMELGRQPAAAAPEPFVARMLDPLFTSA
jgi:hypothetical protein